MGSSIIGSALAAAWLQHRFWGLPADPALSDTSIAHPRLFKQFGRRKVPADYADFISPFVEIT
ncbi:MAG: hypothetical protein J7527_06900, partial [Chitinophagaceae bacterium]|nr:hypothetical protein [Chitinophagaceae bacterium]